MTAVCRHFGSCGGCTLQGLAPADYATAKREAVVRALTKHGVDAQVAQIEQVPPRTRRRGVFRIVPRPGGMEIGFHALKTHVVVDMHECLVLTPELFALVARLREAMAPLLTGGQQIEVHVTQADNGLDLAFRAQQKLNPALTGALASAAAKLKAIRITWNAVLAFESATPIVHFGKAAVKLPPDSFLQPTREGEALLRGHVLDATKGAKTIADLFCGCGTFSLPLAERAAVHAVERDQGVLDALFAASRATPGLKPVTIARRDLFKLPLTPPELARFEAVTLDPPRAGAQAQAREIAVSRVSRVGYVSCDADSFARDAAILLAGGFQVGTVTPVDQFPWSSHIELVAAFRR